ncbi:MAG: hypothetical protein P1V97_23940, partial [Planctomycetota bacterium]|nr:hypothetical protein [Planctomycetota bacterium]
MKGRKKLAIPISIFASLLFSSALCYGQNVKVSLRVENQEVYVGETFIAQVIVSGAKADSTPVFKSKKSTKIDYEGMRDYSQTMTRDINGTVTRTV